MWLALVPHVGTKCITHGCIIASADTTVRPLTKNKEEQKQSISHNFWKVDLMNHQQPSLEEAIGYMRMSETPQWSFSTIYYYCLKLHSAGWNFIEVSASDWNFTRLTWSWPQLSWRVTVKSFNMKSIWFCMLYIDAWPAPVLIFSKFTRTCSNE
jgi:hypothetical protein